MINLNHRSVLNQESLLTAGKNTNTRPEGERQRQSPSGRLGSVTSRKEKKRKKQGVGNRKKVQRSRRGSGLQWSRAGREALLIDSTRLTHGRGSDKGVR